MFLPARGHALVPRSHALLEEIVRPQEAEKDQSVQRITGVADRPTLGDWTVGIAVPREGAMPLHGSMDVLGWEVCFVPRLLERSFLRIA